MRRVLVFAAFGEAATGVALLVVPSLVGRLLFDEELASVAVLFARLTGVALIALGVACWPDPTTLRAYFGMLTYSLLAMLYLVYLGINGAVGVLLWPAVAVHAVLSVLLVLAWRTQRQGPKPNS